jgi:hypothetical protein
LTFHDIPRYAGLLVSMPFPDAFGSQYQIWGSAYIAIALILLLSALYRFRTSLGMNRLLPLTFILIFSIVCLKMGTNRIDINKMATVTAPLFLAAVIASKYSFETIRVRQGAWKVIAPPMVLCLILLVSFSRIDMGRFLHQPRYTRGDLKSYLMTPAEDDESWLSPEMSEVARYIRDHTRPDDYIYAFTSNPIYYYLTKRQNPSRMYINWYNDPQPYTEETLRRLQETNPKIIIYSEKTWMDAPDNVPMEVRVPEINQWIMKKYIYRHTIGNTTLLSDGP